MVSGRSIHTVAAEAHAFCWDNALTPALECASGDEVEFSVRDASGGQLGESSTAADVDVPNWVVGCFVPDAIFEGG